MTSTPITAALSRFYAAEERYVASGGDRFHELAATLHPDIVVHQAASLVYGGEWRGHQGFERWMRAFADTWETLEVRDAEIHEVDGGRVVSLITMRATSRRTGRPLDTRLCQILRFEDGLLVDVRPFYWDTAEVNSVTGHAAQL